MEICIPNSLCAPSAGLPVSSHALLSGAASILFASIVFIGADSMPAFAAESQVSRATLERLTLESAEQLFSERNRELLMAKRTAEAAEADVISAGAPLNPSLSIGTSHFSPSKGVGSGRLLDKGLDTVVGISQVFERGNKRELRAEAAQFNADAARKDEANTARQQLQVLQAAYYDLLLAQDRLAIANTTATLFGKSAEASDRRLRSGDIAATELARIQVEALKARNDARIAHAERDRGQLALGYLIGADREAARIVVTDPWPIDMQPGKKPDFDKIIEQRTDISAAQARVSAAEKKTRSVTFTAHPRYHCRTAIRAFSG